MLPTHFFLTLNFESYVNKPFFYLNLQKPSHEKFICRICLSRLSSDSDVAVHMRMSHSSMKERERPISDEDEIEEQRLV